MQSLEGTDWSLQACRRHGITALCSSIVADLWEKDSRIKKGMIIGQLEEMGGRKTEGKQGTPWANKDTLSW